MLPCTSILLFPVNTMVRRSSHRVEAKKAWISGIGHPRTQLVDHCCHFSVVCYKCKASFRVLSSNRKLFTRHSCVLGLGRTSSQLTLAGASFANLHVQHLKHLRADAAAADIIYTPPVSYECLMLVFPSHGNLWSNALQLLKQARVGDIPQVSSQVEGMAGLES